MQFNLQHFADRIRNFWKRLFCKKRKTDADIYAAGLVPPPAPAVIPEPEFEGNRAERRARKSSLRKKFERERKRFDKFVEPQGDPPKPREKADCAPEKTIETPQVVADTNIPSDPIIVDKHHSDWKTEVLFEEDEILLGEFNFRDTILEQLDRYFIYLDRMRKHDPDSYGLYRNVGATLVPYSAINDITYKNDDDAKKKHKPEHNELSSWFKQARPAFGCLAYGANPVAEEIELTKKKPGRNVCWIPKFMYFSKYEIPPAELQPMAGGDIYKMTVWWDRPQDKKLNMKHGVPDEFGVFVGKKGEVVLLRQLETKMIEAHSKKHRQGSNGYFNIPQRAWRIPHDHITWAKHHGDTARQFLCRVFCDATKRIEYASYSMIRVSVEKNGRYALFSLDQHRMPYFFKDRDYQLTEKGLRKPIFHMVRPHIRKDGTAVPLRFRGQRDFTWAGYSVHISVPGLHHAMLEEFDLGFTDGRWAQPEKRYSSLNKMGQLFRKEMSK